MASLALTTRFVTIGSEDRHQVDLFPDEATQHLTHIANQSIEVHRDWL